MAEIRPLQRDDLPAVATLIDKFLWLPEENTTDFLAAALLDHPWADDAHPSLVALDGGEVIGFIGSQVRRIRLDERELKAVVSSWLVVPEDRRAGAVGARLLRQSISGGQDLTFSDEATPLVMRMWETFGGNLDGARICDWVLVFKPGGWLRTAAVAAVRQTGENREQLAVGALPFQAAGRRLMKRAFPAADPDVVGEDTTAATIVEHLPSLTRKMRLWVDYDEAHLSHLFAQADAYFSSPLVRRLVRRGDTPIGWYAYTPRRGGTSRVLNLTALRDEGDAVLTELVDHARAQGSAALSGRLEPHLLGPLRRRIAVMGFARQPVLHSHDPEVRAELASARSLFTKLDGEWFAHH
jgi:hypothetical protein